MVYYGIFYYLAMIKHLIIENMMVNNKKIKKIYCILIFMKDKIPTHLN